jgi:hypothetical protein
MPSKEEISILYNFSYMKNKLMWNMEMFKTVPLFIGPAPEISKKFHFKKVNKIIINFFLTPQKYGNRQSSLFCWM